ncbi:MAG: ArdC-like ssDNA-binding domain-containing protein [Anaerolineae bacterium]
MTSKQASSATPRRPAMSAGEAMTFDRHSAEHAAILRHIAAARGCPCEPYRDWYTYRRWLAQGYQVRQGEHGVSLEVYAPITRQDPDTGDSVTVGKRPWRSTVFCRCQVDVRDVTR